MAKLDLFSKALSNRIVAFMTDTVWYLDEKSKLDNDLKAMKEVISAYESGAVRVGISDNLTNEEYIAKVRQSIADRQAEYDALVENHDGFTLTDADKDFYKSYKDGKGKEGLVEWLAKYGVKASGNETECKTILSAIAGEKSASRAKLAKSEMKTWTQLRTRNDVLKTMYSKLAEYSIAKGAIKAPQVPDSAKKRYGLDKASKKSN